MAIIPENRMEQILNGENVTPSCRAEYFVKQAIDNAGQGGGGSDLPEPGTAGNVLTSTGDGWESAEPNDTVIVPFTIDGEYNVSTEVSIATIYSASLTKCVIAVATIMGKTMRLPLTWASDHSAYFCGDIEMGGGVNAPVAFNGSSEHDIDTWGKAFIGAAVPPAANGDNGDILGVNNGAYVLVPPSSLSNAPLIVHGTISGSAFSFTDTTVGDVYDAKVANRAVFLDDGDGFRWNLTGALLQGQGSTYALSFGCLKHGEAAGKIIVASIGINGSADTTTGGSVIESDLTINQ